MVNLQDQYTPLAAAVPLGGRPAEAVDWSREISGAAPDRAETPAAAEPAAPAVSQPPEAKLDSWLNCGDRGSGCSTSLDLRSGVSRDVVESPTTVEEARAGSMKAVLGRNLGNFVVATLLIGTQGTTSWEGILYDVGNDYLVIYQTGRDRYIICDIYSLKYIEFYDTRRREMCENILRQNGWHDNN